MLDVFFISREILPSHRGRGLRMVEWMYVALSKSLKITSKVTGPPPETFN